MTGMKITQFWGAIYSGSLVGRTEDTPATRLATQEQRKHYIYASFAIVLATAVLFPNADIIWPGISAFIPAYQTTVIFAHGVAAYLGRVVN